VLNAKTLLAVGFSLFIIIKNNLLVIFLALAENKVMSCGILVLLMCHLEKRYLKDTTIELII